MADSFFGFDASLNNGEHLLPPDDDDCVENEEEEYDALNDETFGGIGDSSALDDDWEQQHEQYAEIAEHKKHSEEIENSLSRLVLDDGDKDSISMLSKSSVWAYTPPPNKNGDAFNRPLFSSLNKVIPQSQGDFFNRTSSGDLFGQQKQSLVPSPILNLHQPQQQQQQQHYQQHFPPNHMRTVEELEKNLIKSSKQLPLQRQQQQILSPKFTAQQQQFRQHLLQHSLRPIPPMMPPIGLGVAPPPGVHMPPQMRHSVPPGLGIPPMFMQGGPPSSMRNPGLIYPPQGGGGGGSYPPNHHHSFNMPPALSRNPGVPPQQHPGILRPPPQQLQQIHQQAQQHQQQQQRNRNDIYGNQKLHQQQQRSGYHQHDKHQMDEYAGLMTSREKQWLLNIQLLQLNTGTPYFDDYYYTMFKERKAKMQQNFQGIPMGGDRNRSFQHHQNNRHHHQQKNNERQDGQTLTPRIYTPLQFENSLGKLQCGSVTAPRKIIDMDIVTPDNSESPVIVRDTRKTKQLLLELEALFGLLLKAEDLHNPMAISNMEKLREIKQKQRLRELELAPTPEQKQEVLRLFKLESEPVVENQHDYILRIVQGLLQEDKFASFLNIRKGKMLLLRLLPYLYLESSFAAYLAEIWTKVLMSISIVGRRDTLGDHILPKLHPFFKRYVQNCTMSDILDIIQGLIEVIRQQENSRSTPLSHQGKAPLYFVLLNRFGVSALVTLLIRTEYLISSDKTTEKQQNDWSNFLTSWADLTGTTANVASPMESIPVQIFTKHCNRFGSLKPDKRGQLEKHLVDTST